ncbi:MAG: amino acid ABC transporter ATP-binding protein [Gammaproteobacteria bacterium]|nr:MAG: amino acid ABC transporter ATP-binding protein [Gammaproteobacteria bacterium]
MNGAPAIRIRGLNKWYGDFHALRDIDLQVASGEKIVICGPSGSGKSTLIRCINALETFQEGEVEVLGQPLRGAAAIQQVRRRVGMVFQQFNLFPHLTVIENLMLAPRRVRGLPEADARALAEQYLARVRLADQADKYPAQLSGGQQQRVAIARALCMEPEIMLFDEPTSALDPEMIQEVLETMLGLAESGITMLCVTHEMGFARQVANRVLFMDEGQVIEAAPPEEFFSRPASERAQAFLGQVLAH